MMINQQTYVKELPKRFEMDKVKTIHTYIDTSTRLDMNESDASVEKKWYRGMIGSLLYVRTSRPNIVFSVGLYARF